MDQIVPILGHWVWWVIAGILLILELMAPGVFFIWLAIAAAVTGLVDLVFNLSWQSELLLFAAASAVSVYAGRAMIRRESAADADHPHLNRRNQGYVGRSYVLEEAIVNGRGKLTIEGTLWEITGPDSPIGTRVKVTGTDGMKLVVEAAG
jgi:membrane protein implicated in regulation of membrane protease activity